MSLLLYVPFDKQKDVQYERTFLQEFLQVIDELKRDYGKWPDKIIFSGSLGRELFVMSERKKWFFNADQTWEDGSNKIIVKYSKKVKQVEEQGAMPEPNQSLHGKTMKGLPSNKTIDALMMSSVGMSKTVGMGMRIERTVRPEVTITLKRQKR